MNEEIRSILGKTAARLARKWRLERADIEQELYLWMLSKLDMDFFDAYMEEDEFVTELRKFKSSVYWAGERYCRKEKAEKEGYSPEDEYFYTLRQLQELLVIYFNVGIEERMPSNSGTPRGEPSPSRYRGAIARAQDPSEGGNHLASMMDVEQGLAGLKASFRQRLEIRFGPCADMSDDTVAGLSQSEIVDLVGVHPETFERIIGNTPDQVRHRTDSALKALQKVLGGSSPWRKQAA